MAGMRSVCWRSGGATPANPPGALSGERTLTCQKAGARRCRKSGAYGADDRNHRQRSGSLSGGWRSSRIPADFAPIAAEGRSEPFQHRPGSGEPEGERAAEIDDIPRHRMFHGQLDASCFPSESPGTLADCTPSSVTITSSRMSCGCGKIVTSCAACSPMPMAKGRGDRWASVRSK